MFGVILIVDVCSCGMEALVLLRMFECCDGTSFWGTPSVVQDHTGHGQESSFILRAPQSSNSRLWEDSNRPGARTAAVNPADYAALYCFCYSRN